jgi:hypothetical protein
MIKYYNKNIEIDKNVIDDIYNLKKEKALIFGLGNDSKMWYNMFKEVYFIENLEEWINKSDIPKENIIKYEYNNITVKSSFNINLDNLEKLFPIPDKIKEIKDIDIIIIDSPKGGCDENPGRLIPIFWTSKYLASKKTIVYIDDSNRKLEKYSIDKLCKNFESRILFKNRNGCMKLWNINKM